MNQETNLSYTKFVFASDVHIPHEDKRALKILHDFRRDFKPDRFIVGVIYYLLTRYHRFQTIAM